MPIRPKGIWRIARAGGGGGTAGITAEPSRDTIPVTRKAPVPSISKLRNVARADILDRHDGVPRRHQHQPGKAAGRQSRGGQDRVARGPHAVTGEQRGQRIGQTLHLRHPSPPFAVHRVRYLAIERIDEIAADRRRRPPPGQVNERRADQDGPGDDEDQRIGETDLTAETASQDHALTSVRALKPLPYGSWLRIRRHEGLASGPGAWPRRIGVPYTRCHKSRSNEQIDERDASLCRSHHDDRSKPSPDWVESEADSAPKRPGRGHPDRPCPNETNDKRAEISALASQSVTASTAPGEGAARRAA